MQTQQAFAMYLGRQVREPALWNTFYPSPFISEVISVEMQTILAEFRLNTKP